MANRNYLVQNLKFGKSVGESKNDRSKNQDKTNTYERHKYDT